MSRLSAETDQFKAYYDDERKLVIVTYYGQLTAEVTATVYGWLFSTAAENPHLFSEAKGTIFDFRQVTRFVKDNFPTVRQQSSQMSTQFDLSGHPHFENSNWGRNPAQEH